MNDLKRWTVDFHDLTIPSPVTDDPDIGRFGDMRSRATANGAKHGTPVILSPSGWPDWRINLFFREGAMADAEPGTWRRYAYSLIVWLDFLEAIGVAWDCATVRHVNAFKDWRITDQRNEEPIRATSFDTDRAGLNTFYTWANGRFGIVNPVATIRAEKERSRPSGYGATRRDPLRPAGSTMREPSRGEGPAVAG
ncbi:hypothetical protein ACWF94_28210 [Streptomyces sp. NPDC055078]